MIALERKVKKKVEKRIRDRWVRKTNTTTYVISEETHNDFFRDAIAAAIADDAAWLKEKSELISKHQEGQKE